MEDHHTSSNKKSYKDSTPEEVKERVKESVSKGVAAVAGALKGFSESAKREDLAGSTKEAIHKAGETTRDLASSAKEEFRHTKDNVKRGDATSTSSSIGSTTPGTRSSSDTTTGVPDLRKSSLSKDNDELA